MHTKKLELKIKYLEYLLIFMYLICILFGIKQFEVWSQITALLVPHDIHANIETLINCFITGHPHFTRALLIFPTFIVSDFLSIDLNTIFSLEILFLIFLIYRLDKSILKNVIPEKYIILILIFFIFLSLFMHGRIMFAIFGNTVLLFLLFKYFYSRSKITKKASAVLFLFALWSVSVSSGTFMVFIGTLIIFLLFNILIELPYMKKNILWAIGIFFFLLVAISPVLITFINKNLDFYGGSFSNMLAHGTGRYIINYLYLLIPIVLFMFLIAYIIIKYFKFYTFLILPSALIISSILIGLFGFSSLVSGISGYFILLYMLIYKNKFKVVLCRK